MINDTAREALTCALDEQLRAARLHRQRQVVEQAQADKSRAQAEAAEARAGHLRAALNGDTGPMTDEEIIDGIVKVLRNGWTGSPAVANWNDEDWRRQAEFYLPVVHKAVIRAGAR